MEVSICSYLWLIYSKKRVCQSFVWLTKEHCPFQLNKYIYLKNYPITTPQSPPPHHPIPTNAPSKNPSPLQHTTTVPSPAPITTAPITTLPSPPLPSPSSPSHHHHHPPITTPPSPLLPSPLPLPLLPSPPTFLYPPSRLNDFNEWFLNVSVLIMSDFSEQGQRQRGGEEREGEISVALFSHSYPSII